MDQRKSLLERYGIPVHHLDFKYIADCKDAREMEKMVHILRSGEEGYYPDLTKSAENKLRELKPHSRLFRVEEQIRGREALPAKEWKPIYDWNHDIKDKDKKLQQLSQTHDADGDLQLPPLRKSGYISLEKKKDENAVSNSSDDSNKLKRIKSTDYRKWDQYDAEEEILRMDLAEERVQEEVERKNHLNTQKYKSTPKIEEILEETNKERDKLQRLSHIEKEKLSEELRLRGNEYFRAKEYDNAVVEYTKAIQAYPDMAVAAYNNRAVTYIKQQKFHESIKDCEECLKLDPRNVKARLRFAEASYAYGKRRESYQLYINVLDVDPTNATALKAITELRKMFEDLPPPNATRLQITDAPAKNPSSTTKSQIPEKSTTIAKLNNQQVAKPSRPSQSNNYDLADLVKPNRIVKNKLLKAAESLGKLTNERQTANSETKSSSSSKQKNEITKSIGKVEVENADVISELRVPGNVKQKASGGKLLIEEI